MHAPGAGDRGADEDSEPVLSKALTLMWGLDVPGARGPRRGLSLEQVLDAAIEIADAEGSPALSMGRVAKHLGFTTMSLYRYVDSKDTLLELVSDRVMGTPPDLTGVATWRDGLAEWAWAEFRGARRHPWWVDLPLAVPPWGPNSMAWLDAGLATLAGTPLPEPVKLQLVLNVSLYVIGRLRMVREIAAGADTGEGIDYPAVLARVVDPQRFPALTVALNERAFDVDEVSWAEADFGFGLERLLDGYEQFVRSYE